MSLRKEAALGFAKAMIKAPTVATRQAGSEVKREVSSQARGGKGGSLIKRIAKIT